MFGYNILSNYNFKTRQVTSRPSLNHHPLTLLEGNLQQKNKQTKNIEKARNDIIKWTLKKGRSAMLYYGGRGGTLV